MTTDSINVAPELLPGSRERANGKISGEATANHEDENIRTLILHIAHCLVDIEDKVQVRAVRGEHVVVLELSAAKEDVGKVIGKQGRTARSIRTILGAAGSKLNRRFTLEILE